ncbi:MAG: serine hydrolase [Flavobacteriales bacterium]|nr:serine hydrolase [Flavobacteriales bacterium]
MRSVPMWSLAGGARGNSTRVMNIPSHDRNRPTSRGVASNNPERLMHKNWIVPLIVWCSTGCTHQENKTTTEVGAVSDSLFREVAFHDLPAQWDSVLRRVHVPGMVVGVVRGGELYVLPIGFRDAALSRPMTSTTPFYIASVTKVFTAQAVLQLAELGRPRSGRAGEEVPAPTATTGYRAHTNDHCTRSAGASQGSQALAHHPGRSLHGTDDRGPLLPAPAGGHDLRRFRLQQSALHLARSCDRGGDRHHLEGIPGSERVRPHGHVRYQLQSEGAGWSGGSVARGIRGWRFANDHRAQDRSHLPCRRWDGFHSPRSVEVAARAHRCQGCRERSARRPPSGGGHAKRTDRDPRGPSVHRRPVAYRLGFGMDAAGTSRQGVRCTQWPF